MRDIFNGQSPNKPASFEITPAYKENASNMDKMLVDGNLRVDIRNWILEQTGVMPDVTVAREGGIVNLYCTGAFMEKIEAQFASRIANVERIPSRDEVKDNNCWKPPGML